jgi:PAT family beta-lactamase induction signal transducer AmpG
MFIGHVGIAFLDVSADAWAIEITHENERGKVNGAMFTGQFAGLAVGSILLAIIADIFGYNTAFITAGLIIILIIIYPLFVKYIIIAKEHQKVGFLLVKELKNKTTQLIALFAPILAISYGVLQFAIPLYSKTILNLDIAQIGVIVGINSAMIAVGSLIGGGITDKFGRKTTLYIFIGASIFFSALLIISTSWQILAFLYSIFGFLIGGYTTATSTMCMDITNPKIGATQYSLLMSLFNIGELTGAMIVGSMIALLGYSRVFLYSAWIFGPALLVLYFINIKSSIKRDNA